MQIRDLIPWGRERSSLSQRQAEADNPLLSLQRDINRVFEDFWNRFERSYAGANGFLTAANPRTDISETEKEVEVSVELPGMDEKDIEVSLTDDVLTIRGEKKNEREEKKKGYYLSERSYGSFYRSIPLPAGVDPEKADARFKSGVLTITLPKTPEAQQKVRRIEVKTV
ncbi:Hsp20/alpha crystallin family protein [Chelativorans intermedius]|uniref:Hsp20/alpha crystallin family protein n=1 Tax=Chelativorans intermedius TaxID=515947 RepID=A0ABV6D4H5_9HYPH|nr:Hsp20/alpha crystallin family protein [Chelativorans intermedius]MCT8997578.1 Hsp20/alpha crystallin family protein [Chelativorans intermedius]